MITIYLDATGFQNFQTGVGRYSYNLLAELLEVRAPEWRFVVLVSAALSERHPLYALVRGRGDVRLRRMRVGTIGPKRDARFLLPLGRRDLYHCLNSNLPLRMGRGTVVTVHDIIYFHYPRFLGRGYRAKLVYYNALMSNVARRAERIIAVSRATAEDFVRHYGGRAPERVREKIAVIYEGATEVGGAGVSAASDGAIGDVATNDTAKRDGATSDGAGGYFLYVGELRPHKNIDRLIEGFGLFRRGSAEAEGARLYIAGSPHNSYALPQPLPRGVEYVGRVGDEELARLYRGAVALCFVSLYEGFGLPILEAMRQRVAVITSNVSSMPEVAGDAAVLVDPTSAPEIARAMGRLYNSPNVRRQLIERGVARVREFSWRTAALETCRVYEEVLGERRGAAGVDSA